MNIEGEEYVHEIQHSSILDQKSFGMVSNEFWSIFLNPVKTGIWKVKDKVTWIYNISVMGIHYSKFIFKLKMTKKKPIYMNQFIYCNSIKFHGLKSQKGSYDFLDIIKQNWPLCSLRAHAHSLAMHAPVCIAAGRTVCHPPLAQLQGLSQIV